MLGNFFMDVLFSILVVGPMYGCLVFVSFCEGQERIEVTRTSVSIAWGIFFLLVWGFYSLTDGAYEQMQANNVAQIEREEQVERDRIDYTIRSYLDQLEEHE